MPKYIVKDTDILHGKKGDKEAELFGPGDQIELSEKEAQPIIHHLELVAEEKKKKVADL